jgi:hypothetical protein
MNPSKSTFKLSALFTFLTVTTTVLTTSASPAPQAPPETQPTTLPATSTPTLFPTPIGGAAPPGQMNEVVVSADLDRSREQIAPSLGAVSYTIGPNQIQDIPGGANAPFNQVLLRAPGVVQDSFGQIHVRGEHANVTYRVNGVLLPQGASSVGGFGQEIDTHMVSSVSLITGTLPANSGSTPAASSTSPANPARPSTTTN